MSRFGKKKYIVVGAAAIIVAAGAGAAVAYWSSTGSGSGSGSVGAGTNDLVAAGDPTTALVPGGSSPISFSIHNTNTTTDEAYTSVTYTVTPSNVNCLASDFTITGLPTGGVVAAGATTTTSATITMADTALNQDGCKGDTLAIAYTIS